MKANHSRNYVPLKLQHFSEEVEGVQEIQDIEEEGIDAYEAFGLTRPEPETPEQTEEIKEEQPPTTEEEPKGIKVKFLKEEQFIPDEEVPTYVQKGLNHDRILQQKTEYEKVLDEVAQIAGFKDHAEFIQNQDTWRQRVEQQKQQVQTNWDNQILEVFEQNGIDRDQAEQFIHYIRENDPVVQQAKQVASQLETQKEQQTLEEAKKSIETKVLQLRSKYTDFDQYADQAFEMVLNGEVRDLERAYKLASMDDKLTNTSKQAEQKAIKQQQLGLRSKVETRTEPSNDPIMSEDQRLAFQMFGIDPKIGQKFIKK